MHIVFLGSTALYAAKHTSLESSSCPSTWLWLTVTQTSRLFVAVWQRTAVWKLGREAILTWYFTAQGGHLSFSRVMFGSLYITG